MWLAEILPGFQGEIGEWGSGYACRGGSTPKQDCNTVTRGFSRPSCRPWAGHLTGWPCPRPNQYWQQPFLYCHVGDWTPLPAFFVRNAKSPDQWPWPGTPTLLLHEPGLRSLRPYPVCSTDCMRPGRSPSLPPPGHSVLSSPSA